mmetsp:Transcript_17126/g.20903  ORF Transcript_17126/g.20903 Transcript_17126/m.20903 type:complete len:253 (+) Transcript_17126:84-842(+)
MKSINFISLLQLLLLAREALGQSWNGCSDLSTSDTKVKKGKATTICFTTGPGTDWGLGVEYNRYSFKPIADEFSRFTLPGSYKSLVQNSDVNEDITVFTSSQTSLSFLRKYYDTTYGIFPHLTAIIDVKNGVAQGIAWDDACVFCSLDVCKENTYNFDGTAAALTEPTKGCYLDKSRCDQIHESGGTQCDLTIYVVWTGTDASGTYLTSSNNRFSSFQPKQIQDQFKDSITQWIPDIDWTSWWTGESSRRDV